MNKENTYSNLAKWCEMYHERSKIKIHPSSVPVELVLEDVLGYIAHLRSNVTMLINALDNMESLVKIQAENIENLTNQVEQLNCTSTKKVKK